MAYFYGFVSFREGICQDNSVTSNLLKHSLGEIEKNTLQSKTHLIWPHSKSDENKTNMTRMPSRPIIQASCIYDSFTAFQMWGPFLHLTSSMIVDSLDLQDKDIKIHRQTGTHPELLPMSIWSYCWGCICWNHVPYAFRRGADSAAHLGNIDPVDKQLMQSHCGFHGVSCIGCSSGFCILCAGHWWRFLRYQSAHSLGGERLDRYGRRGPLGCAFALIQEHDSKKDFHRRPAKRYSWKTFKRRVSVGILL